MSIAISKVKKGDTVILCAFTGMKIGVKEVVAADKSTVTIKTDKGDLVFDRKTAKQIDPEPKAPRFASSIVEDDGSYVPSQRGKKKEDEKPAAKKTTKKAKPEEDEEDTPAPKKATKSATKNKKKSAPAPEPEEEEDEDWDDEEDDFEEIDD